MAAAETANAANATTNDVFEGVHAFVSRTLPDALRKKITQLLAGKHVDLVHFDDPTLTHFVTDSLPSSDSLEYVPTRPGLHFVTPFWVERTVMLGTRQDPAFYSPHPSMLFSGVVATSCDLSKSDNIVMAAGISSLGGQWRNALTKDVTHLFALSTKSNKYETAMHFKNELPMKVLVPHWFDDTVRIGMRNIPTDPYEWPEPSVFSRYTAQTLKALGTSPPTDAEDDSEPKRTRPLSLQKRALYDTVLTETSDLPKQRLASDNIWDGRKVMFGSNLAFNESQREAHYRDVERAGGAIVEWDSPEDELEKIDNTDIYVCQYREGRAFVKVRLYLRDSVPS
jgi:mediator of DNA damage checkpoint protein 1